MLAERKEPQEVVDILAEQGIKISRQAIRGYILSPKYNKIIMRLRRVFEKELMRIPIANKAYRLKLLQQVALEGLLWNIKGFDSKTGRPIYEAKIGITTQAVREAREEMKGSESFEDPIAEEEIAELYNPAVRKDLKRFLN